MNETKQAGHDAVAGPVEPTIMQHTRGPWHVGERSAKTWHLSIYSQDGNEIAKVDVKSALHIQRRTMDATVMAAAPDLMKACAAALAGYPGWQKMIEAAYNKASGAA